MTKRRYRILKDAIDLAKEHPDLDYVFVDVICRLKVVFKDGTSNFFNDIDNLKSMINNRSQVMKQRFLMLTVRYINPSETYNFLRISNLDFQL